MENNPTYTRSGNFYLDSGMDKIVNADGKYLKEIDGGNITIPTRCKKL